MSILLKIKQLLSVWIITKIQRYGSRTVDIHGRTYEVSRDVFNPKYFYTSKFMAEHIRVMPDDAVLDMGTGSGIQAITAAQSASSVVAVDINPEAVSFARKNVILNGVADIVSVLEGDLFAPLGLGVRFNVILFTPPYLEGRPETGFEHALFDPGKILLKRFLQEAGEYLKPDGYVQMLYSSIAGHEDVMHIAEMSGWQCELTAHEKTVTEEFFIYRLRRI